MKAYCSDYLTIGKIVNYIGNEKTYARTSQRVESLFLP
jgi:hypothetical protein